MSSNEGPAGIPARAADAPDAAAPEERERIARRLLELSREMLALGRAGDWVLFAQREAERQQLSSELFATPVPQEAAVIVADCVRRVLDLDQKLIALAEGHRDEAAQGMCDVRRGRQAASAYRRFSR